MAKKSLFISIQISVSIWKDLSSFVHKSQYIYYDCKLLAPVVYFAELVNTTFWVVWEEQHAQYIQFLPQSRPDRKEGSEYTTS